MSYDVTHPAPTLAYATADVRPPSPWLWAVLSAAGLGLVALGGCFLIGVLALYEPNVMFAGNAPVDWSEGRVLFCAVLYAAAFACFAGAAAVLVPTVRAMLRSLADAPGTARTPRNG